MNNNDYYQEAVDNGNYLQAAKLAISFGQGKASRGGAWAWAEAAKEAAAKAGIVVDCGNLSWPNFEKMLDELEKKEKMSCQF